MPASNPIPGVRVIRGYECRRGEKIEFVGADDGPMLQVAHPGGQLTGTVAAWPKVAQAIMDLCCNPTAAPGAHDDELRAMGFDPGRPVPPHGSGP